MSSDKKTKKRLLYTRETLREAMAAIKNGMPVLQASAKYQIPRTTLHNKRLAKDIDKKPGPGTVLTPSEEETLVQWIIDCSNIGMPVAKQQLQNSALMLLKKLKRDHPFTKGRPSHHWYRNFLQRNEKVQKRISDNMAIAKAAATEGGVKNWFANIEKYLRAKDLLGIHPSRIFSTETVLLANPDESESVDSLSVQMTGNATGQLTCPMIVFNEDTISREVCKTAPTEWMIGKSENGSVTAENFYQYVTEFLYPWLVKTKTEFPVVLFIPGRVSHVTMLLTEFCAEHRIELVALHPNSSHLLHPLEPMFSQLRAAWNQGIEIYIQANKTGVLAKENIALFLKSILGTLSINELLKNGFVSCGLYPLSIDSVDFKKIPDRIAAEKVQKDRIEFEPYVANVTPKPIEQQKPVLSPQEFLQLFEERLDPNTLQEFKNADKSADWAGCEKDTALFYYWRSALNDASIPCEIDKDSSNSFLNSTGNADVSDTEFNDVTSFLEIQSQSEDLTEPADPIKIFIKTNDR